jgi:topoisomerase IA-like protein
MAKYGKKAQEKVEEVMRERKRGTLRSGSGQKVKSKKQAIAIGLSEARKEGGKVPEKKGSATKTAKKRTGAKKTAAKKSAAKSGPKKGVRKTSKKAT